MEKFDQKLRDFALLSPLKFYATLYVAYASMIAILAAIPSSQGLHLAAIYAAVAIFGPATPIVFYRFDRKIGRFPAVIVAGSMMVSCGISLAAISAAV